MDKKKIAIRVVMGILLVVVICILYVQLRLYFLYKKTTSLPDALEKIKSPNYVFDTSDSTDAAAIIAGADSVVLKDFDDVDFSGISDADLQAALTDDIF